MDSYESTPPRRETKRISSRWRNPYDVCCREGSMKGNPKPVLQMLSMLRRIVAGLMSRDRFDIRLGVQNENLNLFERRLFNSTSSDETVKWKSLAGCVMSFCSRVMCLTVNRCALQVHWKRCVNCNWVERSLGGHLTSHCTITIEIALTVAIPVHQCELPDHTQTVNIQFADFIGFYFAKPQIESSASSAEHNSA